MRFLLVIILLCFSWIAKATNYYFSSVIGDDNYSITQAQNPFTPWKSLYKLNSFFSNLNSGDSVLFKRGEIFYGSIVINKSGTPGNNIIISSYGTGANPIITGLTTVTGWISTGINLWESTSSVSTLATCKMVVINGLNTPMGRYPNISSTAISPQPEIHPVPGNNGWLNYESHTGIGQITDNELPASPNWTGAEVVVKKFNWVIDHGPITNQSNKTITYLPSTTDTFFDGMSYFIENDIRTLDEQNEWYYNPTTKKLTIYSISQPTNVQIATVQNLIVRNDYNYITFRNINLTGSNEHLIRLSFPNWSDCKGWEFSFCNISFAGKDAVYCNDSSDGFIFTNNTITDANNNGLDIGHSNTNALIEHNVISNTGINAGMLDMTTDGRKAGTGLRVEGNPNVYGANIIRYNKVSHTGSNGIEFKGNNIRVSKNFIEDFCSVKIDGGGIYTWGGDGTQVFNNMVVEDNIIINSSYLGSIGTALENSQLSVNGIYLDGQSSNVIVRRNSIFHVNGDGIYMNSPVNCMIIGNTIYDARYSQINCNKQIDLPLLNLIIKQNIAVARDLYTSNGLTPSTASNQRCFYYNSRVNDLQANVTADSNYYGRPIDNDIVIPVNPSPSYGLPGFGQWGTMCNVYGTNYIGYGEYGPMETHTLGSWKTAYPLLDQHSTKSPKKVNSVYDIRFEYNETTVNKTISLGANYIDMKGISYPGSITLAPFTSTILIKNDTINIPPIAEAGPNQLIIVPVNNVEIQGNGIDYDGTITLYQWTKISGPSVGSLSNTTSALTSAIGLIGGVYKFELKVTDNKGAIGTDTTTIIYQTFVVPVTLIDFFAVARSGKVLLQWSTENEINSSHFEVERSNDGRNFEAIGIVNANGNSNTMLDYQLLDNFPENGINYYRLKMISKGGQYYYSKTISVILKNSNPGFIEIESAAIKNNMLQIFISSVKKQSAKLCLYDANGRMVMPVLNITLQKGMNNLNRAVNLACGVYYCKLACNEQRINLSLLSVE